MRTRSSVGLALLCMLALASSADSEEINRTDSLGDALPRHAIARLGTLRFQFPGHIASLSFSPDGKHLVVGGVATAPRSGLVIYDAATGRRLRNIPLKNLHGISAQYSSDGNQLLWANGARTAVIMDLDTGEQQSIPLPAPAQQVACSPDGSYIATATARGTDIWSTGKIEKVCSLPSATRLAFTPDGKRVVLAQTGLSPRNTKHLTVYAADTGKKIQDLGEKRAYYADVAVSGDGRYIAASRRGRAKSPVHVWDAESGKLLAEIKGFRRYAKRVLFNPKTHQLVVLDLDNASGVFDPRTGRKIRALTIGNHQRNSAFALSPDGRHAAVGSDFSRIQLWDLRNGNQVDRHVGHLGGVTAATFSTDGTQIVTGGQDTTVRLWKVRTGKQVRVFQGHRVHTSDLSFSPDGKHIASTEPSIGGGRSVLLWHTEQDKPIHRFVPQNPRTRAESVQFSEDGNQIFVAWFGGTLTTYNTETGELGDLYCIRDDNDPYPYMQTLLSPNARYLACRRGPSLFVTELDSKARAAVDTSLRIRYLQQISFSHRGELVAWSDYERVTVTNVRSGQRLASIRFDTKVPRGVAMSFSHDGRFLALGRPDGSVGLWDLYENRMATVLPGHRFRIAASEAESSQGQGSHSSATTHVSDLEFSPDDRQLLTAGGDSTTMVWDIAAATNHVCEIQGDPNLSACWDAMADQDAHKSYRAYLEFRAAGENAVPFLAGKLKPVGQPQAQTVAHNVALLNSADYRDRVKAYQQLRHFGPVLRKQLTQALDASADLAAKRRLRKLLADMDSLLLARRTHRDLMAIRVLQSIANPQAVAALKRISTGLDVAWQTRSARNALDQLGLAEDR